MEKINRFCIDCYHKRPNKRKALDLIFNKNASVIETIDKPFIYLTLGADQLLDVLNLMEVCYFEDIEKIFSYEEKPHKVKIAKDCQIVKIFNKWHKDEDTRNKIEIIEKHFPNDLKNFIKPYTKKPKIFFFDDTGWFDEKDANMLCTLIKSEIINKNDIFIITSSLGNIGWSPIKGKAIAQYRRYHYGKIEKIVENIVKDNIVDLYVDYALILYNDFDARTNSSKRQMTAKHLGKVKYRDETRMTMGVWSYQFIEGSERITLPNPFTDTYMHGSELNIFKGMKIKNESK